MEIHINFKNQSLQKSDPDPIHLQYGIAVVETIKQKFISLNLRVSTAATRQ